jgi:hypothetical protein
VSLAFDSGHYGILHNENEYMVIDGHYKQITLKSRIKREALLFVLAIFPRFKNVAVDKIAKKTCVIHSRCGWGVEGCIRVSLCSFQDERMNFMCCPLRNPRQCVRTVKELYTI